MPTIGRSDLPEVQNNIDLFGEVFVYPVFDLLNGSRISRGYVERALNGGLVAIHVTINNFATIAPYPTLRQSLRELAAIRAHYESLTDVTLVIERFEDFERALTQGKLGIVRSGR